MRMNTIGSFITLCLLTPATAHPHCQNTSMTGPDTTSVVLTDNPGDSIGDGIFISVEKMPRFEGGDINTFQKWVISEIELPAELNADSVSGRVVVSFVVNKEGSVEQVKALSSQDARLTAAVIKTVERSPHWEPGRHKDVPVAVQQFLSVTFRVVATPIDPDDEIFLEVGVMPKFRGKSLYHFSEWVASMVVYPDFALKNNIEGNVIVSFVVEKDGAVSTVEIVSSSYNIFNDEAIRVVRRSPKWTPGMKDGEPVRVKFMIPINFMLHW